MIIEVVIASIVLVMACDNFIKGNIEGLLHDIIFFTCIVFIFIISMIGFLVSKPKVKHNPNARTDVCQWL
jgi:hypothetical protein